MASPAPASEATRVSDFGMLGTIEVPRVERGPTVNAARTHDAWRGAAETFVLGYTGRRGAAGSESFKARSVLQDELGQIHVRVRQSIAGLPVVGAELILHVEAKSGKVIGINGSFAPDSELPRSAAVNAGAAIEYAAAEYGIDSSLVLGAPELTYIVVEDGSVRLAWTNMVSYRDEEGEQIDRIFADALTGAAIARHPQIDHAKYREIFTCNNTTVLPGTLLFTEGGSSTDSTAMAAYNNLGIAYDYYDDNHNRDSWDGEGATIRASVHYGVNVNNAAWAPQQQFWFGDGNGVLFSPLAFSLDIVAHEFTHAVDQETANLVGGSSEPGMLNESIADCLGAAAEAYSDGSVNAGVWKIGDEVYTPGTSGDALRYMNDPAINGDRDYYPGRSIGGDPHSNGGIQNLAFYLLVQGGSHPRGKTFYNVSSIGMTAAEKIFYLALAAYADSGTNFREMREHTRKAAEEIYGLNSTQHTAVWNAWAAVGNHWWEDFATMANGATIITSTYTSSSSSNYHTGHLDGPAGTNFSLYLERWDGTTWQIAASDLTSGSDEILAYKGPTGQYRWRVHALTGSGSLKLYTNRP